MFHCNGQLHTGFWMLFAEHHSGKCEYCITQNYMMVVVPDQARSLQTKVKQKKNCMAVFAFVHCVPKL